MWLRPRNTNWRAAGFTPLHYVDVVCHFLKWPTFQLVQEQLGHTLTESPKVYERDISD
jgi:hypothetical protein